MALTVASGYLAHLSLGTAWVIPAFLLYGTTFAFGEAAAHELNHGTGFRSLTCGVYYGPRSRLKRAAPLRDSRQGGGPYSPGDQDQDGYKA